jgi:hypothetical protein
LNLETLWHLEPPELLETLWLLVHLSLLELLIPHSQLLELLYSPDFPHFLYFLYFLELLVNLGYLLSVLSNYLSH